MKESFAKLVGEKSSPLFRIMAGYDIQSPPNRRFENNISAFHVGKGYFISVAHNLITHNNIPRSISPQQYAILLAGLPPQFLQLFHSNFQLDQGLGKVRWTENQASVPGIMAALPQIAYDCRYPNLYNDGICKPYLLLQFREQEFFDDANLQARFGGGRYFFEPELNRHTYLVDLSLEKIADSSDISIYKVSDEFADLIPLIPSLPVDVGSVDVDSPNIYCLQGAPINELGRLLNKAQIEGYLDHYSPQANIRNRLYVFEGNRYLIKGYFRFGSSGAPYLRYNPEADSFAFIGVQSEACPLQMVIQGNRDNNAQFVNAIATPLTNIRSELQSIGILDGNS